MYWLLVPNSALYQTSSFPAFFCFKSNNCRRLSISLFCLSIYMLHCEFLYSYASQCVLTRLKHCAMCIQYMRSLTCQLQKLLDVMLGWLVGYRERSAASGLACCSSFSKRVCLGLVQSSRVSVSAHMFCDSMLHHRRTRFSPTQLLLHRKNLLVNWSDFHQCRCHSHCRAWPQQYPLCIMYSACMQ